MHQRDRDCCELRVPRRRRSEARRAFYEWREYELRLQLRAQRRLDVIQMGLHGRTGVPGRARLKRVVDCPVLVQQRAARRALPEHDLTVVEHTFAQQIEHRAHHVQHDDIVARLDDRHVELGIQPRHPAALEEP